MAIFNSALKPGKPLQRKAAMTASRKPTKSNGKRKHRIDGYHDQKMLDACKGEPCYVTIPGVCIGGTNTTVPAHSNQSKHGKGMGLKAKDMYTVPACFACHFEIDQGKTFTQEQKFAFWDAAFARWEPKRAIKMSQKQNPATVRAVPGLIQRIGVAE